MSGYIFLVLAIVTNSIGNVLFKAGATIEGFTPRKGMLIGLGLAVGLVNTLSFIKSLETIQLGVAPDRGREALARVRQELEMLVRDGPSEEEVASAR